MTTKENQQQLEDMLEEVRRIRLELSGLSESAKAISTAIEGILADKVNDAQSECDDQYVHKFD